MAFRGALRGDRKWNSTTEIWFPAASFPAFVTPGSCFVQNAVRESVVWRQGDDQPRRRMRLPLIAGMLKGHKGVDYVTAAVFGKF